MVGVQDKIWDVSVRICCTRRFLKVNLKCFLFKNVAPCLWKKFSEKREGQTEEVYRNKFVNTPLKECMILSLSFSNDRTQLYHFNINLIFSRNARVQP